MAAAAEAGEAKAHRRLAEALRQRLGRQNSAPTRRRRHGSLHLTILREQNGDLARSAPSRAPPRGTGPTAILLAGRDQEIKVLREAWAAAAEASRG